MLRRQANATVQTNMRIKEKLRRKLEAAARENQVSFNEEVGRRLAESFQIESLDSMLANLPERIGLILGTGSQERTGPPPWVLPSSQVLKKKGGNT